MELTPIRCKYEGEELREVNWKKKYINLKNNGAAELTKITKFKLSEWSQLFFIKKSET